jgi:hypothetical protein
VYDIEETGDNGVDIEGGDVRLDDPLGKAVDGENYRGEGVGFEAGVNHG